MKVDFKACVIIISLFMGTQIFASQLNDPVLSPTKSNPAVLKPGDQLEVHVAMRLPLTPPPGVQQPRAWSGWSLVLRRRAAVALRGASPEVKYVVKILRVRPGGTGKYIITAQSLPWMSSGLYDLILECPGFKGLSVDAVKVGTWSGLVDVVIPMDGPGLSASLKGRKLNAFEITLSRSPGEENDLSDVGRIFSYRLSSLSEVLFKDAVSVGMPLSLTWEREGEEFRPVDWRNVKIKAEGAIKNVIWDFGDGDWGSGLSVRHRWFFTLEATVNVIAFDTLGNITHISESRSLKKPMSRSKMSCSCRNVGAVGERDYFFKIFKLTGCLLK